jgi:hypothetical protein
MPRLPDAPPVDADLKILFVLELLLADMVGDDLDLAALDDLFKVFAADPARVENAGRALADARRRWTQ